MSSNYSKTASVVSVENNFKTRKLCNIFAFFLNILMTI